MTLYASGFWTYQYLLFIRQIRTEMVSCVAYTTQYN